MHQSTCNALQSPPTHRQRNMGSPQGPDVANAAPARTPAFSPLTRSQHRGTDDWLHQGAGFSEIGYPA